MIWHSPDELGMILSSSRLSKNVGIGFEPMFANSAGMEPERRLFSRFSHSRLLQFPNSLGISPVSELLARVNHKSEVNLPRVRGIDPERLLKDRSRAWITGKLPYSEGMVPVKWLKARIKNFKYNVSRAWINPISSGISPEKLFPHNLSIPNGNPPERLLVLRSRYSKLLHRAKAFPISPENPLLEMFITTKLLQIPGKTGQISPPSLFIDKSRISKLYSPVRLSSPSMMLCDRFKNLRLRHVPKSAGTAFSSVFFDRSRYVRPVNSEKLSKIFPARLSPERLTPVTRFPTPSHEIPGHLHGDSSVEFHSVYFDPLFTRF
nr:hypothetical protein VIGAN_01456900 [Ipomoea batatas]